MAGSMSPLPRLLAVLLLSSPAVHAADRYEGLAYPLGSQALAYREEHWRYDDAGVPARLVLYRCPDGRAFARKQVRDRPSAIAPDFEFIDARDGYREGVRSRAGAREVYWQPRGDAPPKRKPLAFPPQAVVDAGFDALVRAQWLRLMAGTPVSARFLLPSSLALLPVKLRTLASPGSAGEVGFGMRLDAWYGFAAPETRVFYRRRDRWLSRFEGIGTIRDARGRHLPVRIEFPDALRAAAVSQAQVLHALQEPLDGQCRT